MRNDDSACIMRFGAEYLENRYIQVGQIK